MEAEHSADESLTARTERQVNLRTRLIAVDAVMLSIAWVVAMFQGDRHGRSIVDGLVLAGAATLLGMWQIHLNELYLARVSIIRSVELSRLLRSVAVASVGLLIVMRFYVTGTRSREVAVGALFSFTALVIGRSAYRAWIASLRKSGMFVRPVVIVGANREAAEIVELLQDHPESGFRVVGVVGSKAEAANSGLLDSWRGTTAATPQVLRDHGSNGVIVVVSALGAAEMSDLVRDLQERQVHINLSNGVRGINYRRLRAAPISHEPLFYVEQPSLRKRERIVKRAFDIVVSILMLIVLAPVYGLIALAIKMSDRGPVLFRQERVGQGGSHFKVLKFRTMVVDAEARLRELQATNERNGPLFKMTRDPRVTKIGHILRETSLDELPQLINVIKGEMSLVGPRPALPSEVAQFDQRLLERMKVPPGMSGLWQVEARDNPSFNAYRRLDLFYVDNWSLALDLVIILATAEQLGAKVVKALWPGKAEAPAPAAPAQRATGHDQPNAA